MKAKFQSKIIPLNEFFIVKIPDETSLLLPTRGFVLAKISVLNQSMILPIEPDGFGSHWFDCRQLFQTNEEMINDESLFDKIFEFQLDSDVTWYPPELSEDFIKALENHDLLPLWEKITVKAKWEWHRWVKSAQQAKTREARIKAGCDKLSKGLKRPCCYDHTSSSVPEVSKSGKLIV